jgi:hypothetical protein
MAHRPPRIDRGSKKRLARLRFRGHWPNPWPAAIVLAWILCWWAVHSWLHATGTVVD